MKFIDVMVAAKFLNSPLFAHSAEPESKNPGSVSSFFIRGRTRGGASRAF
jgi:hypothetical protein